MNSEIDDIFAEHEDTVITQVRYNLNIDNPDMCVVNNSLKDSECGHFVDTCCNQKVLALPGGLDKVQQIASLLIKDNVR